MSPESADPAPRLLVVGHLTEDVDPRSGEGRLGGAAAYASLLSHRFGVPTTLLTSADRDFPWLASLAGIEIRRVPSPDRTRFVNTYRSDGSRAQRVRSRAERIPDRVIHGVIAGLPPGSAVLWAPVVDEIGIAGPPLPRPSDCSRTGRRSLSAAALQGFLRRFDRAGRVHRRPLPVALPHRLSTVDLVCLSEQDPASPADIEALRTPWVAITRGRRGALLRGPGGSAESIVPALAREVDPTGAGDVFAAALTIARWKGMLPAAAGRLAAATAACAVEAPGVDGVPSLARASSRAGTPRGRSG